MMDRRQNKCPRCGGNMFLRVDHDGRYLECLQCSFETEAGEVSLPAWLAPQGARPAPVSRVYLSAR